MDFLHDMLEAQGYSVKLRKRLTVPCTDCKKDTPWDEAKWVVSTWQGNDPYCTDCYESLLRKLEGRSR